MPFISSVRRYGYAPAGALEKTTVTFTLPNTAGNGQITIANEIFALKNITIKQFGVLLTSTGTVNIYYKTGTIASNFNQSGWTFAGFANIATSGLQSIPISLNINVPANTSLSFIISSPGLSYTNGISVGTTYASNSDLQVRSGYGSSNGAPPLSSVFQPRNFNGLIVYEV
jgi:hypothetical protein